MSEEQVVRNCAPTLAGLKTGNLFACPYENREDLLDFLRPARLEKDLSSASGEALLSEFGYNCRGGSRCLTRLARRLKQQEDFPHEIGLFLSYPPEDVKGFLEHKPCKCVGCWKVYENEEAAKKTFAKYKACTRVYCRQLASGIDIERLTVAG